MDIIDFMRNQASSLKKEKTVGRVPFSISREFRDFLDDKDHTETQIEIRKKQLALEFEQKLKDEFDSRMESIEIRHDKMWNKIYDALDLDPNGSYYYNRSTGDIVMRIEHDAEQQSSSPFSY
jgi:hypothetical protein